MGDGKPQSGYVLSHPKIADYLRVERFRAAEKRIRHGFARCGSAHLKAVNAGEVGIEEASHYFLRFLPRHLEMAGRPTEDFMAMVENGWRRAWECWDGSQRGFAAAVYDAWRSCRRVQPSAQIGAQSRCSLALSSINSLGRNIPVSLLVAVVKDGRCRQQARYYAELKGATADAVGALAGISAQISSPTEATEMALAALDLAMTSTG